MTSQGVERSEGVWGWHHVHYPILYSSLFFLCFAFLFTFPLLCFAFLGTIHVENLKIQKKMALTLPCPCDCVLWCFALRSWGRFHVENPENLEKMALTLPCPVVSFCSALRRSVLMFPFCSAGTLAPRFPPWCVLMSSQVGRTSIGILSRVDDGG